MLDILRPLSIEALIASAIRPRTSQSASDSPRLIELTCYRVLARKGDARAAALLQSSYGRDKFSQLGLSLDRTE